MERRELMSGVALTAVPADKFKRCKISLTFTFPASRSTATAHALLPLVMERGYAGCPDMTRLSRRLATLYGAGMRVSGGTLGPNRVLTFGVSGIRNEYAVAGEDLVSEYLELAFGMAFQPDAPDGAFRADAVAVEKQKLKELQESEINEKRLYCMRQARRKFFGDDVAGLERYGYPDEVDAVTPSGLYQLWRETVETAQIDLLVMGAPAEQAEQRLRQQLAAFDRRPVPLCQPHPMPVQQPAYYTEPADTAQGKLCMLFTLAQPLPLEDLSKMRMAMAILGGKPTSRLFVNVREKQSLCYYCAAGYTQLGGVMSIDSGVEMADAVRTQQAILHEIDELVRHPVGEEELQDACRYLTGALESIGDGLSDMENWIMGELSRGTLYTPQQVAQQLACVTSADVQRMMGLFRLSVVYLLGKENADE